jgi:hypothetical protein
MNSGHLCKKNILEETPNEGERWGCLVQDRASRCIVAHAHGRIGDELVDQAVGITVARTHCRPLDWCGDGWRGYPAVIRRHYQSPSKTGKRGRPRLVLPSTVRLTQVIKHRDEHGRLLSVEIKAALGTKIACAHPVHIERFNGCLRDHLNALTRKTHAFAKTDATWDALLCLQIFDHNFGRYHRSLRLPHPSFPGRYLHRSPAMTLGISDHLWSLQDLLTTPL